MRNPDTTYGEDFFLRRREIMWRNEIICPAIVGLFTPRSIVDVGCGIGDMLHFYSGYRIEILGIESTENARRYSMIDPENLLIHDFRKPLPNLGRRFDLCTCWNAIFHMEPERAHTVCRNLAALSDTIAFNSVPQPDVHPYWHLNTGNADYWTEVMEDIGYMRDCLDEEVLQISWRQWRHKPIIKYIADTVLVFKRRI